MQASFGPKRNAGLVALITASLLLFGALVGAGSAEAAKKGKVVACAAKKGEHKGLLRLSKKGKCKKAEKKVVFNKKGRKGEIGPAGPRGPKGAAGQPSQELVTTVDTLRNQVNALCTQLTLVTDQTGLLGDVLDAIDVLLIGLTPAPSPLPNFGCP